jgi:hypothetical protein
MKGIWILCFFCSAIFFASVSCAHVKRNKSNKSGKLISFRISVTSTSAYCGGARPTEEMLQALSKQIPIVGKKIFIRKGETNDLRQVIFANTMSDTSGKAIFMLPPGKYSIVDERKADSAYYKSLVKNYSSGTGSFSPIDLKCLSEWLKQPDLIIEVKRGAANDFNINYHRPCEWSSVPCAQYTGPLPP